MPSSIALVQFITMIYYAVKIQRVVSEACQDEAALIRINLSQERFEKFHLPGVELSIV